MKKGLKTFLIILFCLGMFGAFLPDFVDITPKPAGSYEALTELILSDKPDSEVIKYLKENKLSKEDINQKDKNGYSALYLAIDKGRAGVIDKLISKGADKNQITNLTIRDKSGRKILRSSPVLYAAWKGDAACLKRLMKKNADSQIEADFIIPTSPEATYIRLLYPLDAAFYNRRSIDFSSVYKELSEDKLNLEHSHFSGTKNDLSEVRTIELLKKYDLLEVK